MCTPPLSEEPQAECPNEQSDRGQTNGPSLSEKVWVGIKQFLSEFRQPITVFTALLVLATLLQWCTLDKTLKDGRLRDRAFIYLTPTFVEYPPQNPNTLAVGVEVWNAGNTPPRGLSIRHACVKSERAPLDPFKTREWHKAELPRIGPKKTFPLQMQECQFPFSMRELIVQKKVFIAVGMAAEYIDGLNLEATRSTETNVVLNLDPSGGHSFGFTESHNCSDEECQKQYDKALSKETTPNPPTSATQSKPLPN